MLVILSFLAVMIGPAWVVAQARLAEPGVSVSPAVLATFGCGAASIIVSGIAFRARVCHRVFVCGRYSAASQSQERQQLRGQHRSTHALIRAPLCRCALLVTSILLAVKCGFCVVATVARSSHLNRFIVMAVVGVIPSAIICYIQLVPHVNAPGESPSLSSGFSQSGRTSNHVAMLFVVRCSLFNLCFCGKPIYTGVVLIALALATIGLWLMVCSLCDVACFVCCCLI